MLKPFLIAFTLVSGIAQAQTSLQDTTYLQTIVKREPIAFIPYELKDPNSGKLLSPNDQIELVGAAAEAWEAKYISARDYYAGINELERIWNSFGYSLRNPEDINKLKAVAPDLEKIEKQVAVLETAVREFDEKIMTVKRDVEAELKDFEAKAKGSAEAKYNELYAKVKAKYPEESEFIENLKEDPTMLQKPDKNLSNMVHKEWNIEKGDKSSFFVKGNAQLDLGANLKNASALSDARVDVTVMNSIQANVLYLYGKANIADTGIGSVETGVEVGGNVIDFLTNKKEGKVFDIRLSDKNKTAEKGPWKKEVRVGQDFPFSIGPIPAVFEIGFLGLVYLDTGVSVDAGNYAIGMNLYPGLSTSAYASLAIGIPVAKAGAEGQIVLLNTELAIGGRLALQTNTESGKKKLVLSVRGDHTTTALAGRVVLFAQVKLPIIGKQRYERQLWSLPGKAVTGVLFDFTKEADENGIILTGAPEQSDLEEMNLDNELVKFFADTNPKLSTVSLQETLKELAVLSSEIEALKNEAQSLATVE